MTQSPLPCLSVAAHSLCSSSCGMSSSPQRRRPVSTCREVQARPLSNLYQVDTPSVILMLLIKVLATVINQSDAPQPANLKLTELSPLMHLTDDKTNGVQTISH